MKNYTFYSDAGHGWLEVDLQELVTLGVAHAISSYSHIKRTDEGTKVYLEEDCDATLFSETMTSRGIEFAVTHFDHGMDSPIRNFLRFHEGRV